MGIDAGLGADPFLENLEHYQSGQFDGGTHYGTNSTNTNLDINELLDKSSPKFPLYIDGGTAEEHFNVFEKRPPAEDEPLATRKRTRSSSIHTIIPLGAVPDLVSEPELSRLVKRQWPSERQAESPILDHVPTPKPTPLPTPSGPDYCYRTSNEPGPGLYDNNDQSGGTGSPVPSPHN
ncbi:hypothetical protein K458DRAFT_395466 [Lentithecium fluviatile CBS 122367]|uniref:Uncharacterized protein n=1 Tax=Lentithecium fluviatile CBS 122367 TaxID=1168545 RepID=A0A6G1IIC5_9PLEO|nr:hypothetical protein K458DRAFT_395466 [Lentithecium fluviatile CBS 122367]